MHNLVPHFILEQHIQGEHDGKSSQSGHFPAATLFTDISGFSTITNTLMHHGQHGAEVLAAIMCTVFDPLVKAVYDQGGFIVGYAGDAFTAVFPGDEAEEGGPGPSCAQRALAAGWQIQQYMIAHPNHTTPYGSFQFSAKVGLAAGEVAWGIVRSQDDTQATFFFRGSAIDDCAGAEKHATKGMVLLSPTIHPLLADQVTSLPVDDHFRVLQVTADAPAPQPIDLPPASVEQMARFFPHEIVTQAHSGEFRQVVNVFIGLEGELDHEQLAQFMQSVFVLQEQFGGLLHRLDFGDKGCNLLLFWGAPVSREDDVANALRFVQELQAAQPIPLRAGVTRRIAHAGFIGSDLHQEYTCYGNGVNLAARLRMAAPWDSIWLDEPVAQRARRVFAVECEGEYHFKGFSEPQAVYVLLEQQAPDIASFYQGEMVGREAELAQLAGFVQPLWAAEGETRFAGILAVEGEAGLGKSRLVTEFLKRLVPGEAECASSSVQWFLCQTDQTVRQPLNPFRYWLRHYFDQSPAQSETRNKRAFGRQLDQLTAAVPPETEDLRQALERGRSFLGALLGLHWPNSPYAQLEPQGRHEWTVTALKSLILAESLRQPVIINLEDGQWLDAESIEFIERLVRQVDAYPLAILATARPTIGDKPLFGAAAYQKIDLGLMKDADLVQLAANLLEGAIGDDVVALLAERAEGNPFFAEQILLYLRERGGIEVADGTWRLTGDRPASALPSDVRAIFTARLDRLTGAVKDVVQTAAVLGREFELRVLAQMLRDDAALPDKVRSAEEEAIWSALSQVRYIFKHALLRDAAYEMQLRARRRELHQLAAQALERLYADDLTPHYGAIAYHYEAACRLGLAAVRDQAIAALRQAGERAAGDYENAAAVDYYSRALALTPEDVAPESAEAERRYDLLLGREAVYHLQGAREAQAGDLAALEALATARRRPTEQATVALRWAWYANNTSDYPRAIEQAQAAITAAQAAGDVAQEAAGQLAWGGALRQQGEYAAAAEHSEQVLALA
ncbi:MAG: AAA family ATPase, partial [Thermoflexales bacterium]|nr:AAA family ATPase [Thermoflexales bacterium]